MPRFVLYRILGNDLPPRHAVGQTLSNLEFILRHEPPLPDCEKRWVVNRIFDEATEKQVISLLEKHHQSYLSIPFSEDEYLARGIEFDALPGEFYLYTAESRSLAPINRLRLLERCYAPRNRYVMNVNGARNAALREGREVAEWILPFDGNCFFPATAWQELVKSVEAATDARYLVVPMARVIGNDRLLDPDFRAVRLEEPQLGFRRDAMESFDERLRYGAMDKSSLLHRLGVPGPWQQYAAIQKTWEPLDLGPSSEAGRFVTAGWVARLDSGRSELEVDEDARFTRRLQAIVGMWRQVEGRVAPRHLPADKMYFFEAAVLSRERELWQRGDPELDGLVQRLASMANGVRRIPSAGIEEVPDTCSFFRALTASTLGWYLTGRREPLQHALELAQALFMPPVRAGREGDIFSGGLAFELAPALDAVRLLATEKAAEGMRAEARRWCETFVDWLTHDESALEAGSVHGHRGSAHDLLVVPAALFAGLPALARHHLNLARMRLAARSRGRHQATAEGGTMGRQFEMMLLRVGRAMGWNVNDISRDLPGEAVTGHASPALPIFWRLGRPDDVPPWPGVSAGSADTIAGG